MRRVTAGPPDVVVRPPWVLEVEAWVLSWFKDGSLITREFSSRQERDREAETLILQGNQTYSTVSYRRLPR